MQESKTRRIMPRRINSHHRRDSPLSHQNPDHFWSLSFSFDFSPRRTCFQGTSRVFCGLAVIFSDCQLTAQRSWLV